MELVGVDINYDDRPEYAGEDYINKPFTGDDLSIEIIFNSRDHDYSTTNTIAKITIPVPPITAAPISNLPSAT